MQNRLALMVLTAWVAVVLCLCSCTPGPGTGSVEPPPAGGAVGDDAADAGATDPTTVGEGDDGAAAAVDASMVSASVGDTIGILIFREGRLDRTEVVDSDGTINLPLVGRVSVVGLNKYQIEEIVAKRYEEDGFLRSPVVTAEIRSRHRAASMASISVWGEVRNPGNVAVPPGGQIGLLDVISAVGGFSPVAAKTRIQITRRDPATGKKNVFKVNFDRIVSGRQDDIELFPGDILYVDESFL